jgi:hypothetical protein
MTWGWDTGCYFRPNAHADRGTLHLTIASQGTPIDALMGRPETAAAVLYFDICSSWFAKKKDCQHHAQDRAAHGVDNGNWTGPKSDGGGNAGARRVCCRISTFSPDYK